MEYSQYENGDVYVSKVQLVSMNGANRGIMPQIIELSIFEDITKASTYCEIIVNDAINLLKTFPIVGEEKIIIEYSVPGRETASYSFWIYRISNIQADEKHARYSYVLHGIAGEALTNSTATVTKGYNAKISDIVKDIMSKNLDSKTPLSVEETKGIYPIAFTRRAPFSAIEMIQTRACSVNNKSSSYLFFQNKNGFHFKTVEQLMKDGVQNIGDKVYQAFTFMGHEFQNPDELHQILAMTHGQQFDMLEALNNGVLSLGHDSFDITTKKRSSYNYNLTDFPKFKNLQENGSSLFTKNLYSKFGADPAYRLFNVMDSSKGETFINDFLAKKIGFIYSNFNSIADIYIHGDSNITARTVISIKTPITDGFTNKKNPTKEYLTSGNYLVMRCRHLIQFSMQKPKYNQTLSLIRGIYS